MIPPGIAVDSFGDRSRKPFRDESQRPLVCAAGQRSADSARQTEPCRQSLAESARQTAPGRQVRTSSAQISVQIKKERTKIINAEKILKGTKNN